MQSQVDEISPVMVEVRVEVPWETVRKELDGAYRRVQKTAKVRGFRPGKVPRSVLKNLMGPSVTGEVTNQLVQRGISSAVDEHTLSAVAVADVEEPAITDGEPMVFTAKVEVRPTIEDVKVDGLDVERKLRSVSDADVDKKLDELRNQHADLVAPEPERPAKDGDVLTLSIQLTLDGKLREDLSTDETEIELGSGRMLPDLEAGLVGTEIGKPKALDVTFPEDYGHEELAGQPVHFDVTLKSLRERRLPELDDEFAKDLDHESLDAMRKSIRSEQEEQATREADSLLKEALVDKLIDENPVPVPPSMVEQQAKSSMQEMLRFQQMLGQDLSLGEDMQERFQTEAERRVRAGLLFGAIARGQDIKVTPEDIDAELVAIAERTGKHIAKVKADHQGQERERLETQLLENKLLEYLRSKATIKETEADDPAAAADKA